MQPDLVLNERKVLAKGWGIKGMRLKLLQAGAWGEIQCLVTAVLFVLFLLQSNVANVRSTECKKTNKNKEPAG